MRSRDPVPGVAVIGCGYWGKNLVRVFHRLGALRWICDTDRGQLAEIGRQYPGVRTTDRMEAALADGAVRAVVIATPAGTHVALARQVLAAGKDLFVEKPLALSYGDGKGLVQEAERRGAILMVGHVLQYHPAILRLKQIVDAGDLGDLYYLYSSRVNLGRVRQEENILWSFAPHDISVMLLLVGRLPISVATFGGIYLHHNVADVTISTYTFDDGIQGHIFVSWLHPFKEQRLVVVGSRKMAVFDNVATDGKLRMYDKSVTWAGETAVSRQGAETEVPLPDDEPLELECAHFLECVERRARPRTDGWEGLRVLQVLEMSQRSLVEGRRVMFAPAEAEALDA